MTNAVTNNTIYTQNVVLWQYDNAVKFCAVVSLIESLGKKCTQALWDYFVECVHGLFTLTGMTSQELAAKIDDYSLALWGILVGLPRPSLTVSGTTAPMSKILYRKVLAARLKLMQTNGSLRDISQYCEDIFGTGKVTVSDGLDMSITYALSSATALDTDAELKALYQLDANSTTDDKYWQFFPAAVRDNGDPVTRFVAFRGQYNAEKLAKSGVVADTTTKPNFFSGKANAGTEQDPVWVDWKGVFHPKTRTWRFYDEAMNNASLLDKTVNSQGIMLVSIDEVAYISKITDKTTTNTKVFTKSATGWTLSGTSVSLGEYGISVKGNPATNDTITVVYAPYTISYASGVWTLTRGGNSATQPGRATSIWGDYGVCFMKKSDQSGTFPNKTLIAIHS